MGKPDLGDRIAQTLVFATASMCFGNGLFMVVAPTRWYEVLETVQHTGPGNAHFIRDIGFIYVVTSGLLFYACQNLYLRWKAALAGAAWLTLHAFLHVWEVTANGIPPADLVHDALGVVGLPLMIWAALAIQFVRERVTPAGLPKAALIGVMEKRLPGEFAYMKEIATAPGHAWEKFMNFIPSSRHRHAAPSDLFHAARMGAVLSEDCGPCALTVAQGAMENGWTRAQANALLSRRFGSLEQEEVFAFGEAIARQSADAFERGYAIERKYGRAVRLELAMTAALSRSYPAMKRGLALQKPARSQSSMSDLSIRYQIDFPALQPP